MANDVNHVRAALARAVAERRLPDDAIDVAAKQIAAAKQPIRESTSVSEGSALTT